MTLLVLDDVRNFLPGYNLTDAQLGVAMRLVSGWLREDTGLIVLPDPLPDTDVLWAPALELTALVASNPELLASKTVGPTSRAWPMVQQRDAIRARVRGSAAAASAAPRGSFPPAPVWPDPTLRSQADPWIYRPAT